MQRDAFGTLLDELFDVIDSGFGKLPSWAQITAVLIILGGIMALGIWALCQN